MQVKLSFWSTRTNAMAPPIVFSLTLQDPTKAISLCIDSVALSIWTYRQWMEWLVEFWFRLKLNKSKNVSLIKTPRSIDPLLRLPAINRLQYKEVGGWPFGRRRLCLAVSDPSRQRTSGGFIDGFVDVGCNFWQRSQHETLLTMRTPLPTVKWFVICGARNSFTDREK